MDKVEQLREYLGLTALHMAKLIGVSRQTYWNWSNADTVSKHSVGKVKKCVAKVRPLLANRQWPRGGVHIPDSRSRYERLLAIISSDL